MATKREMIKAKNAVARIARATLKAAEKFEAGLLNAGETITLNGIDYTVNKLGQKVRLPRRDSPVKTEEVRHVLLNTRVVEPEEVLMICGQWIYDYLIQNDFLRAEAGKSYLWVTKKAAAKYNLPQPVIAGAVCAFA